MKKKLEDAYIPDKGTRKEKIVIGLSGGIDSYVMAYLLKIQKYDLIAVTIVNSWDDLESDQSNALSCHINQNRLEQIKDFCHRMNFPLHVIKTGNEFKEKVVETFLAQKVLGKYPTHCWNCHENRMELLYNKMKEVGAKHFATGHYAKIFHQESHASVYVHTSNDEKHDQSSLLARLPHDILNSLMLPLSDLTKKEVLKLAENFGVIDEEKKINMFECLSENSEILPVIAQKVPAKFIGNGEITNVINNINYGQHDGILSFKAGQEIEVRDSGKLTRMKIAKYSYSDKRVAVEPVSYFKQSKLLLVNCTLSEEVNWIEPFKGVVVNSHHEESECWIHMKTLSSVFVELSGPSEFIEGEIVTVLKKKSKNSKIFLTGKVQYLPVEEVQDEGGPSATKINVTLDF